MEELLLHTATAWLVWEKVVLTLPGGVCVRDTMTPTEKKAYWVIPSAIKDVHICTC